MAFSMRTIALASIFLALSGGALAGSLTAVNTGLSHAGVVAGNHVTGTAYVATGQSITAVDLNSFSMLNFGGNPNNVTDLASETRRNWLASVWSNNTVHVANMNTQMEVGVASYANPVGGICFDVRSGRLFTLDSVTGQINIVDSAGGTSGMFHHGYDFGAPYHIANDSANQVVYQTRQNLLDGLYSDPTNPSYGALSGQWTLAAPGVGHNGRS